MSLAITVIRAREPAGCRIAANAQSKNAAYRARCPAGCLPSNAVTVPDRGPGDASRQRARAPVLAGGPPIVSSGDAGTPLRSSAYNGSRSVRKKGL